ncbi:MAG: NAD-dependent deacylase [Planctomycetes bacterium]|nr:NAD-dependent deacylase [Planctomycetota bacterium]
MIDQARRILHEASRVVSFSGAGLSAESGVPTFRDAQTGGLWAKHDPMRLASPQGFADDPELVSQWYAHRRRAIAEAQPNGAHIALARHPEMIHVTQNVDDLLHRAGAKQVIQLHGTIAADRCHASCGYEEAVDMTDPPGLRHCPDCGDQLRPAVVWFGEALPSSAWLDAEQACRDCDVLLVIGTSAVVYPAAGLIGLAKSAGAKIVIVNTQASDASSLADVELLGNASEVVPALLEEPARPR